MATEIIPLSTIDFTSQTYNVQDVNLIPSFEIDTNLTSESYIEFFIYDNNKNLIIPNYNFTEYTVLNDGQSAGTNNSLSQIEINPEKALIDYGFTQGEYTTYFNFLNKKIGSNLQQLYISEISSNRTEIRLDSTILSAYDILSTTSALITERSNTPYFLDFYLNFGNNKLAIANNIQLDSQDSNNPTILVKLYEPLPEEIDINSTLWVVTAVEEPIAYQVIFEDIPVVFIDSQGIKGPNFNIDLKDQVNNSTQELSYLDLITTSLTSSQNQLNSLLDEKEIKINVDYTDFTNFVHFSSAQTRLENFYYKVTLIEEYNNSISLLNNTTNSTVAVSSSAAVYESKINSIITNFDGYEYYLYYETGSTPWPKTNNQKPYTLAASDSTQVLTWFGSTNYDSPYYGGLILSSSEFDNGNKDNLLYTIPEFLRDDPANDPYQLFVEMVGQHYDNIWIYYKDITNKYGADNRLQYGVSNDIVADAIRDFGVKLYQNNFSNEDLYTAFLGLTPEGGLFPFPNITGSLPTPSGYEYVNTKISASSDYLPLDDVNKSLYKRIYHNIPYLLKAKGTLPGLRALITSYGIPDTILRINEYGGKDKINVNDWDYWQNEFNYAFKTEGNNFISSSWNSTNINWNSPDTTPSTLAFRFKTNGLSSTNIPYSQSLWRKGNDVHLVLRYTGSGYTSGSYSGSIADPYNQYALLDFYPNYTTSPNESSSLYLPFFDGGWWSVMVNRDNGTSNFTLSAGNKIYEGGNNGTLLGFYSTSSITASTDVDWYSNGDSFFASSSIINGSTYKQFSGSIQEIRYYNIKLSEESFKDFTMNPSSIEGNTLNSGPNELIFRASLGGELYTGSNSIHPKVTGSWSTTSSFTSNSNFNFNSTPTFVSNEEYFFYDQPIIGIKNSVSDKIRIEDNVMPEGDVLSPFMALSQQANISQSYTPSINYLEVAFSPQNEINEDIMDQMGYFNIGEFIGDPRLRSSSAESYPALDALRDDYFQKYTKNYNLVDFIRLIKFFDNSLFKMIKDFVPARTSLASGVVIKQHLLERNKYPQPQVEWSNVTYTGSINTTQIWNPLLQENELSHSLIETFDGGTGGSFERFNYLGNTAQSWTESVNTPSGSVLVIHSSQDEFYDGEFSGSVITVTTQSLHAPYPLDSQDFNYTPVRYTPNNFNLGLGDTLAQDLFLNSLTVPSQGQMLLLTPWTSTVYQNGILQLISGPSYVKIHKLDNNGIDNNTPLGQITKLLVKYSSPSTYYTLNVLSISEYPTYYSYLVNTLGDNSTDDYIRNYNVSSSTTSSLTLGGPNLQTLVSWSKTTGNIDNYFNTSSGIYTSSMTNNVALYISASATFQGSSGGNANFIMRVAGADGSVTDLATITGSITVGNPSMSLSATYYSFPGDELKLQISRNSGTPVFLTGSINVTQSIAPSSAEQDSIIIEPYILLPHYYNSDNNPIINNVSVDRLSYNYQDVDYSAGILTPQNFALLRSGSAIKAAVQDSNYTTKRHIIPRYEGSKSTSQHLNYWTPGDTGTYGKTPTVDSLKTSVAYCDWIGGNTPDQMGTSLAHIKYLINADGTISIPNTSENSLYNNQGNFITGERFQLTSTTVGSQISPYRTIVRGASRISPILYTQLGHTPPSWTSSINLYNENSPATINDNTVNAILIKNPSDIYAQTITAGETQIGNTDTSNGWSVIYDPGDNMKPDLYGKYQYEVDNDTITDGVNLIIDAQFIIANTYNNAIEIVITPYKTSGGELLSPPEYYIIGSKNKTINFNYNLSPEADFIATDEIYFSIKYITTPIGSGTIAIVANGSYWKITQNPIPNPLPTITVGTGSIWNYPTSASWSQYSSSQAGIIYIPITGSALNSYYDVPGIRQQSISGSGFFDIELDWNIIVGDEFRFEGREDRTYMVNKVFSPTNQSPDRISNTGSLEIHLSNAIPSSSINLDHFVIRRYIDDASGIIFEGLKPSGATGPYILSPEFVVPELNKSLDQFITDLTQKGLL